MLHGRCHCGAVVFEMPNEVAFSTICYCHDRRRQSGAPMIAWAMVPADSVVVSGDPKVYASSAHGRRSFCGACGAGLFFSNAPLQRMGMMQAPIAALDNPDAIAPKTQVQVAERIGWVDSVHTLPAFERFPVSG
jgi:hypothetical protein